MVFRLSREGNGMSEKDAPYLAARNISVSYPSQPRLGRDRTGAGHIAFSDLTLELEAGTRLGLVGYNGAGKSTLLRTLAGVYVPQKGEVIVRGKRASVFSATSGFMPNATGFENIFLRGTLLGLSYQQIQELVPKIVEFADLGDWIEQPLYKYSSGMVLRLAFSITTSIHADILLLDEWLGAGDANFLERAQARMDAMVEKTSILVLATHNTNLMRNICDEAIVMGEGGILFRGDVEEAAKIYTRMRKTGRFDKTALVPPSQQ